MAKTLIAALLLAGIAAGPNDAAAQKNAAQTTPSTKEAVTARSTSGTTSSLPKTPVQPTRSVSADADAAPNIAVDTLPDYFYCEIAAPHLPVHRATGVLFDFGQKTGAWRYNFLTDDAGNKLLFGSGMEALNYMIRQGWEFVQAYASGKEGDISHYLLRIAPERLTDAQRAGLLTPPKREPPKKEEKK